MISDNGVICQEKFKKFVNAKAQISIYNDLVYVFSKTATLEEYLKEKPEGTFCEELLICRKEIWKKLHQYDIKIAETVLSKFIHIGTTKELIDLLKNDEYCFQKNILSNKRRRYRIFY